MYVLNALDASSNCNVPRMREKLSPHVVRMAGARCKCTRGSLASAITLIFHGDFLNNLNFCVFCHLCSHARAFLILSCPMNYVPHYSKCRA